MKVRVCVAWEIVVDGQIDPLDIDTTTEYISGYADTLLELFESLVALDTISSQYSFVQVSMVTYRSS
jgi:hypothetical protein